MGLPLLSRPVACFALASGILPLPATEFHVATAGLDGNPGTASQPLRTISAAAAVAQPGDVITVHAGVYREHVNPPRGGTSGSRRIIYRAAPGQKVVVKGSEIVRGWRRLANDSWETTVPNTLFGEFNPYADAIHGEWYHTPPDGFDRHTGAVYLNGCWMDEAREPGDVLAPAGARALWSAEVHAQHTVIRAQFKDVDPNEELVEINVRRTIFYPDAPGRNYITVRGFTMCQAATPWSGAMSEQVGLVGTHWSKGWIIEDNTISHSVNTGITLGRYDLRKFGASLPPATAPGFVKSCELALAHGWSKHTVGSHVVRNNRISHCEKNGIHGSLGGIFSTIEGNTIHHIAVRGWINGPDVAGIKLLASHDAVIRNNHVHHCGGTGGLWLDWMAQGTRVTGNLMHDNTRDLFMEVNHGPFLVDHNLFLSARSLQDWSQGGAYAHNLFAGTVVGRAETRRTPYFDPHTTDNLRLSDIRHKDLRFHNNLFVGPGGLAGLSEVTHNLHAGGNVYAAGAKPASGEDDAVVTPDFQPALKLVRKSDGWWFTMEFDQAWFASPRQLVTTELLGRARIPDASFEQRDGTPYELDTDHLGRKKITGNPAPGPFRWTNPLPLTINIRPGQQPRDLRSTTTPRSR